MRERGIDLRHTTLSELPVRLSGCHIDVVLAAWTPSDSELAIVHVVRPRWTMPILLYTFAPCLASQRASALDAGVDDVCVVLAMEELVARVNALHRRSSGTVVSSFSRGAIEIDIPTRSVQVNGVGVDLTPNEFTVLSLLAARAPHAVAKLELANALGYADPSQSHAVKQTILRLRDKLGCAATQVKAISGFGYRLDCA